MREHPGEKTEQPTPRKLEDAAKKGQYPRSSEVQTVIVLVCGLLAMMLAGGESWRQLILTYSITLSHIHTIPLSMETLQSYSMQGAVLMVKVVGPLVLAAMAGGLLAGALQSRFQTASEAMTANWSRLNPAEGIKRLFSFRSAVPTLLAILKLITVISLSYNQIVSILNDPIFYSAISPGRVGQFLYATAVSIILHVCGALAIIAILDYAWQHWRTNKDLMMTKDEVKEETKNAEGDPLVKGRLRRQRQRMTQRKMLQEVPQADVVVTNPTHLAVALRYDRAVMRAPRVVAKGARLNAQRIRELAQQHQVPIVENKPVARLLFKHGRVGGEIPAALFAAVAEILAWVYRMNPYRYYAEGKQANG